MNRINENPKMVSKVWTFLVLLAMSVNAQDDMVSLRFELICMVYPSLACLFWRLPLASAALFTTLVLKDKIKSTLNSK